MDEQGPEALATDRPEATGDAGVRTTRRYDSTLRRQRATETRDRIVDAGCDVLADSSIRDWRGLTIRAVARRAGVNERTVYRHFENERGLRNEVMRRLEQRAGIELSELRLEDVGDVTARILGTVSAHPLEPRAPMDPTLSETGGRNREALRRAVAEGTEGWSSSDQMVAAAMFDVLWAVAAYERLAVDWQLDGAQATAGITWVVSLIEDAIRDGRRPGDGSEAPRR